MNWTRAMIVLGIAATPALIYALLLLWLYTGKRSVFWIDRRQLLTGIGLVGIVATGAAMLGPDWWRHVLAMGMSATLWGGLQMVRRMIEDHIAEGKREAILERQAQR